MWFFLTGNLKIVRGTIQTQNCVHGIYGSCKVQMKAIWRGRLWGRVRIKLSIRA